MSDSDKTGPAWGRLLIEQYFILNWDFSSTENPDQQRSRLVTDFLNLNILPLKWFKIPKDLPAQGFGFRLPTTEEIDIILRPYRCEELRWYAMDPYPDDICPYLLRTYYSTSEDQRAKDDAQMEEWIDTEIFGEEAEWAVLDSEDLFNFGPGPDSWRRIYDILPELAGPLLIQPSRSSDGERIVKRVPEPSDDILKNMYPYFKRDLAIAKENDPGAWLHERDSVIESTGTALQKVATSTYMIIADEEAFQTGKLLVLYLDGFRRVIREARIDGERDDIGSIVGSWMETSDLLEYSTLSERYRVNGDLGRELYQLTEVLADL
ncbi:hypothetical protein N7532_007858 [Penicillium argentinense]|uniref:Uncharacterized protein n=1 Tax=Penicillium argentinense TaxID=1131581 RepID=A0A9W9K121_9EURO|nr:uncharacterized protein N7532_007858 [Penicillium argentinense]KAJ5089174.1 hypothetical protein N7532_007858 [Penicillium argentinense]